MGNGDDYGGKPDRIAFPFQATVGDSEDSSTVHHLATDNGSSLRNL
jgi:hypothetical protein